MQEDVVKQASDVDLTVKRRKLYFINEQVEWDICKYIWTGCTSIPLRDKIMENASELIRQIIRKQGLHTIYQGHEESSFGDLLQTAWCQIEKTLYKYRAAPHCRNCFSPDRPANSILYIARDNEYGIKTLAEVIELNNGKCPKCDTILMELEIIEPEQGRFGGSETILYRGASKVFNLWSQVARTVILAYIKKEGRDKRNSNSYVGHLDNQRKPVSDVIYRFLAEAREICKFNDEHIKIIDGIEKLVETDDRPHDGIIGKLVANTNLNRQSITSFMKLIKLRSFEFTDSPLSYENENKSGIKDRKELEEE